MSDESRMDIHIAVNDVDGKVVPTITVESEFAGPTARPFVIQVLRQLADGIEENDGALIHDVPASEPRRGLDAVVTMVNGHMVTARSGNLQRAIDAVEGGQCRE